MNVDRPPPSSHETWRGSKLLEVSVHEGNPKLASLTKSNPGSFCSTRRIRCRTKNRCSCGACLLEHWCRVFVGRCSNSTYLTGYPLSSGLNDDGEIFYRCSRSWEVTPYLLPRTITVSAASTHLASYTTYRLAWKYDEEKLIPPNPKDYIKPWKW